MALNGFFVFSLELNDDKEYKSKTKKKKKKKTREIIIGSIRTLNTDHIRFY